MTPDDVAARLRRIRPAVAARTGMVDRGDHDLNKGQAAPASLRPASVLVPLVDRRPELTVLLTQRTADLPTHAGQISFPGGRRNEGDVDAIDTALRETEEEIGIGRRHISVLGTLDNYATGTGFIITPVVGIVSPPFEIRPDPREVADVFEVPLSFFLDPLNHELRSAIWAGRERNFYVMPYEDRYIWGATAGMLKNLYDVLMDQVAERDAG